MPETYTLSDSISALPAGSIYARPIDSVRREDFMIHVRGLQIDATVERIDPSGGMTWMVRAFDHHAGEYVATATVTGTRYRAAQTVAGLLAGLALTHGVDPILPTGTQLRVQLAD